MCRLQSDNQLLELSLRDQVLETSGLRSLLPCLHLIRTVRLNGSQFDSSSIRKLIDVASEVSFGESIKHALFPRSVRLENCSLHLKLLSFFQ